MSGHSKWAQIKRQKGVTDVKRGLMFTKLSTAIAIAVREGRGITDPSQNFKLRLAIEKARSLNMPKNNIERAMQKGAGAGIAGGLEEVVYEGFGPGGVAVIVDAITDNKIRTTAEVKNVFDKNNGSLGTPGAVMYQFQLKGLIIAKKGNKSIDELFLLAADASAEDIEDAGEEVLIYTKSDELGKVRDNLAQLISITDAQLTRKPTATVQIAEKETGLKVLSFMEKLEDLADVQKVYSNFDILDNLL